MTSLRERLERKIESESAQRNPMINGCLMYKAGANSLIPLVLELSEAMEFYKREHELWKTNIFEQNKAEKALQKIEAWADGKECICGEINARNCQIHQI